MAQLQPDSGWIYQCDDIVVEPRAHRLERAGMAISVEPKAYAVLVVLLQQAGEVVGKEALLDAAWGHRHVTPGVLTRVISQLRHALGDCVSQPRYIATVHSLGYRFIGDVHRTPAASPAIEDALPLIASNDDEAPEPTPAPASTRPPRRWLAAAITLVVLVAMLAAATLWEPPRVHVAAPRQTPRPALALMPFADELESRPPPLHPHRWTHARRMAVDICPLPQDEPTGTLRAAGYLMLRPEQGPAAQP